MLPKSKIIFGAPKMRNRFCYPVKMFILCNSHSLSLCFIFLFGFCTLVHDVCSLLLLIKLTLFILLRQHICRFFTLLKAIAKSYVKLLLLRVRKSGNCRHRDSWKSDNLSESRAERHELKSRFVLFILLFFFPRFLGGKRKGEIITKVVILSHAFLLYLSESNQ